MKVNPYKNPFIVVEGVDGCGKSTLIEGLKKWDKKNKIGAIFTKEPTDGNWGQMIRDILGNHGLKADKTKIKPEELQELYIKDRLEHRKAEAVFLEEYPIFSDRDFMSTLVYGTAENIPASLILLKHKDILKEFFFVPDLILVLDLSAEEAMKRSGLSGKVADYFEEKLAMREKLRKGYFYFSDMFISNGVNLKIIDASVSPRKILKSALMHIEEVFKKKGGK